MRVNRDEGESGNPDWRQRPTPFAHGVYPLEMGGYGNGVYIPPTGHQIHPVATHHLGHPYYSEVYPFQSGSIPQPLPNHFGIPPGNMPYPIQYPPGEPGRYTGGPFLTGPPHIPFPGPNPQPQPYPHYSHSFPVSEECLGQAFPYVPAQHPAVPHSSRPDRLWPSPYSVPDDSHKYVSKEEIIRDLEESRLKVEMPCRTLFIRNLGFRANGKKIADAFSKFGPLKDIADLIDKRGLMFITFYDIRHAEKALKELHGSTVEGRKLDVHYSLPKQEVDVKAPCSKEHNQGTLLVQLVNPTESVAPAELERIVRVHGEIRRVRDFKNNELKKYFEFFDSRDCVKAYGALRGSLFKGGKVEVEYAWDLPESMRLAQANLRGDPIRDGRARPAPPSSHSSSSMAMAAPPIPGSYYPPHPSSSGRREYDRYVPHGESEPGHGKHHRERRSRSRSRSPGHTERHRLPTLTGRSNELEFFEDRRGSGKSSKVPPEPPKDPRLVEGPSDPRLKNGLVRAEPTEETKIDTKCLPPPLANVTTPTSSDGAGSGNPNGSSNQLFEQMSNLLSILNNQRNGGAPSLSPSAPGAAQPPAGPSSSAAAQQLAELLLHQADGNQKAMKH